MPAIKIILLLALLLYGGYAEYRAAEKVREMKVEGLKFKVRCSGFVVAGPGSRFKVQG